MVIVYTYPSPQIFNPRMERSIIKPQGLNYRKTQFGPLVNSQAAGVYNAFPGKIIGVFKEQVRNPTFFTLPFAYYNIFCLHNVTFLLRDPKSYQIFRQTLTALSAHHHCVLYTCLSLQGHRFVPSDDPTAVVSRRGEGMMVMPQERLTQFLICPHLLR